MMCSSGPSRALCGAVDANTHYPVIVWPPYSHRFGGMPLLSPVRMPSGLLPLLESEPDAAALEAARILVMRDSGMASGIVNWRLAQRDAVIADERTMQSG